MANNKYTRRQKYISTDGGLTFNPVTPPEYIKGELIETDSVDCGAEVITWVPVEDVYICESLVPAQYRWFTVSGEYVCVDGDKCSKEKQQVSYDSGSTWTDTGETRAGSIIETNSDYCKNNPGLILNGLTFSNQGYFGADNSSNYTQKILVSATNQLSVLDNPSAVDGTSDPWPQAGNEGQLGYTNLMDFLSYNGKFQYWGIGCKKNGKFSVFGVSVDNIIDTVTFDYSSLSQIPECPYNLQIDYGVWPTSTGSWPSGWDGALRNVVFKSGGENYSAWATRSGSKKTGAVVIHNFSKNGVFFSLPNLNDKLTIGYYIEMRKTNSTHNFAVIGIEPIRTNLTKYGRLMVFDMDEYKVYKTPMLSFDQYHNNYRQYE